MNKEDIMFIIAILFLMVGGIIEIIWFIKMFLSDD